MRPAPFFARWQSGPVVAGAFDARLVLDDIGLFAGHYPGAPIFPGTFLIEALFQAASTALGGEVRLEEIIACRFHSPLLPDDEIVAHFALKEATGGQTRVEVIASGRAKAAELTMLVAPISDADAAPAAAAALWAQAGPSTGELDAAFIHRTLPHRPPALLVDGARVLELPGTGPALLARKAITRGEPCYAGAETSRAYPSLLVVESFCQSCGLLRAATGSAAEPGDAGKVPVVAKLAGLRFTGEATAGDVIEHQVRLVVRTADGAVFSGQSSVGGRVVLQVARVVAATTSLPSLLASG